MFRIGQGFDLHRLVEGRDLILGGINIPFSKGLLGHSDADVLLHAIIDAFIGALALGDIGKFFPDSDPQYKDADSRKLLKLVAGYIKDCGYSIVNLDATVIIEEPKLRPYINLICQNIADDLDIHVSQVNVKAKTSEKIGIVGNGDAVIAQSIVLLTK